MCEPHFYARRAENASTKWARRPTPSRPTQSFSGCTRVPYPLFNPPGQGGEKTDLDGPWLGAPTKPHSPTKHQPKAAIRIEVAASPCPRLGRAAELVVPTGVGLALRPCLAFFAVNKS
jgi:hypothetical protein